MRSRTFTRLCTAAAVLLGTAGARAQAPVFEPGPCRAGAPEDARCGVVRVPENRDQPGGRMLALNVVVIPAKSATPVRQAITGFGGGPGQAATEMAWLADRFEALRGDRDVLLMDQRGTGHSAPLQCTLRDEDDPQSYLGDFLPPDRVARCLEELGRNADLTRYGYIEFAHDMEAVRMALGYGPLDVWGGSYGTRAALVYMRTYPGSVRSALLEGVVPPEFVQPGGYAQAMQAALEGLARDCRADAVCNGAFPDFMNETRAVADRLERAPGTAEITDPETGRRVRLTLTRATFVDLIRRKLYDAGTAGQIPFLVHRAFQGDYAPAVRDALQDRRGYARYLWWGLSLAITCTEDVPFVDLAQAARDNGPTLLGDWRVRQQAAACRGWPRYAIPANYHQPVRLETPTLLVSGEYDPVTPASGGEQAMAGLPNGLHVVVPHAAHGLGGMPGVECVEPLLIRFFRQASVRGLDLSCVRAVRRPPFVLDEPRTITLDRAAAERFAGTWVSTEPALEMRIEALDGGALRGSLESRNFTVIASPLSPTEFHWEGFPPDFVFRFSEDGRTLTMPGQNQPTITLTRR